MLIDPRLFHPDAISEETARYNAQLRATLEAAPSITTMEPQAIRDARASGDGVFGPLVFSDLARKITVPGPGGSIPVRIVAGEQIDAIYLHFHGGGFVIGSEDSHDPAHEAVFRETNAAVFSVGYRLAPEHHYPAGVDDCEAAAAWLVENAKAEFGTDILLVGGESAGAHLAVSTLVRMRDKHDFTDFAGANLVYGGYTVGETPSIRNWDKGNLILDREIIHWFMEQTFASEIDPENPDAAPLYADLTHMPPALFTVGTWDPLIDANLIMAARWAGAGCEAELALYPGGIHAFDAFEEHLEIARQARDKMHRWLRARIDSVNATS